VYSTPSVPNPSEPDDSSLDSILSSKKVLIQDRLSMLMGAFYERRTIQAEISDQIESDLTKCQNHIFQLENASYFSLQRDWEQKKFDLWKELRQEQAGCFRDLQMIQRDIRDTLIEYIKEKQTEALFQ